MRKPLSIVAILLLTSLFFVGCSNTSPDNNDTIYDLLLQMSKTYIGEMCNVEYESLEQYKSETFSNEMIQGAFAIVECIDTDFYITVRHDGEDIMISGKSVAKCRVVDLDEVFNNYDVKVDKILEFVQDYYLIPTNEQDKINMFKSFGVEFKEDTVGMEIKDGDYILEVQENVDYTLNLHNDTLPMEAGQKYTGAIISDNSVNTIHYLSPLENAQRYETFQMSQSTMNIATEIKEIFTIK